MKKEKRCYPVRIGKTALSFVLCFVLVFGYTYKHPTEAKAAAVAPVVISVAAGGILVYTILTALGVAASDAVPDDSVRIECEKIWTSLPESVRNQVYMDSLGTMAAGGVLIKAVWQRFCMEHPFIAALIGGTVTQLPAETTTPTAFWSGLSDGTMLTPDAANAYSLVQMFEQKYGVKLVNRIQQDSYSYINSASSLKVERVYKMSEVSAGLSDKIEVGDTLTQVECFNTSDGHVCLKVTNRSISADSENISDYWYKDNEVYSGLMLAVVSFVYQGQLHFGYMYSSDVAGVEEPVYLYGDIRHGTGLYTGKDVVNVADDAWWAAQLSALNTGLDVVLDRIAGAQGVDRDKVKVHVPPDTTFPDALGKTQSDVVGKTVATPEDTARDVITNQDKVGDGTKAEEKTDAGEGEKPDEGEGENPSKPKPPGLPSMTLPEKLFKTKFPFCLPWDLYNAVAGMVAPPVPIKFVVPFLYVDSLGWHFDITIDLAPFEKLAVISRWGFSLLWTVGLIMVSRKLIGA